MRETRRRWGKQQQHWRVKEGEKLKLFFTLLWQPLEQIAQPIGMLRLCFKSMNTSGIFVLGERSCGSESENCLTGTMVEHAHVPTQRFHCALHPTPLAVICGFRLVCVSSYLSVVRRSYTYRDVLDANMCSTAAENGHLAMLKWARDEGFPWDVRTCSAAAKNGHNAILQWARETECPWDCETCDALASNRNLTMLQWAREKGCYMDGNVFTGAAANGHLAVLQWARENGYPWGNNMGVMAAGNGHLEILQWLTSEGCPWDKRDGMNAASSHGQSAIHSWIRRNHGRSAIYGGN